MFFHGWGAHHITEIHPPCKLRCCTSHHLPIFPTSIHTTSINTWISSHADFVLSKAEVRPASVRVNEGLPWLGKALAMAIHSCPLVSAQVARLKGYLLWPLHLPWLPTPITCTHSPLLPHLIHCSHGTDHVPTDLTNILVYLQVCDHLQLMLVFICALICSVYVHIYLCTITYWVWVCTTHAWINLYDHVFLYPLSCVWSYTNFACVDVCAIMHHLHTV